MEINNGNGIEPIESNRKSQSTMTYTKINFKIDGKKRKHFLSRMATNKYRKND